MKLFDEIPYLENEHVILKKITEKDADVIQEMCSNGHVTRYLPTFLFEGGFADKKDAVREMYGDIFLKKESLLLGIFPVEDPEKMAGIFEFYNYDANWNKVSIGARLNESQWHRGLAENAITLAMDYLFNRTDVKRVTAHVMVENIYSSRAVMRLGFRMRREAVPEDWGFDKPVLVNKYVYEKWGNIKYVKIGSGSKTMVILPGLALKSTLGAANSIARNFKIFTDYTIYLFDDRDNIGPDYTIRERAGDIAAEMKTLGLKAAFFFGASMGGMTGLYLAIDHPELVEKLYLCSACSKPDPDTAKMITAWRDLAAAGRTQELINTSIDEIYSPETVSRFGNVLKSGVGEVSETEISGFVSLVNAVLNVDANDELDRIKCPVMVVCAKGDKVVPERCSREMADRIGCEIYVYGEEYGHGVYDEAPDHNRRMLEFFEQ